jgi:hypothetical protein
MASKFIPIPASAPASTPQFHLCRSPDIQSEPGPALAGKQDTVSPLSRTVIFYEKVNGCTPLLFSLDAKNPYLKIGAARPYLVISKWQDIDRKVIPFIFGVIE